MNAKSIGTILTAVAVLGLAGCAYPGYGGADYRGYQTGTEQTVRFGVVEAVRVIRIDAPQTGVGATSGAILGGIAGSTVGGGSGQAAAAVAGAVLGGIIGSHIEADANQGNGLEITVLLDGGRYIAVVQAPDETFRIGDRVRVLSGQGITRVTH
ncbi:MAG: glycine zipper 2TM domain-containing protein [Betaproteobacteria bacterium]|nr:glycine zipper 2TM domain-containing protein [Betaproteobacteria bacterium]